MDVIRPKYPEKTAHFAKGQHEAWIAGTRQPNKRSAIAVAARSLDGFGAPYHFCAPSRDLDSTDQKAFLRAASDALQTQENGSEITVYTRDTYPKTVIENGEVWKQNNWRLESGQPVKNREIVEEVLRIIAERQLIVNVVHCPKGQSPHEEILDRLHAEAKAKAKEDRIP